MRDAARMRRESQLLLLVSAFPAGVSCMVAKR